MNKQGFTLIEILSTITIMGIIATITSINIIKIFDNKKEIAQNNQKNIITTAACLYIELNENQNLKNECLKNGCLISTNSLIKAGLLNKDDIEKEVFINISKKNNEKICEIKEK